MSKAIDVEKTPIDYKAFLNSLSSKKEGELKGQLYLVSSEDCPPCDDAKEHFKEDISEGTIKVVDKEDEKGWDIIRTLGINIVPALVFEQEDGAFCNINELGKIDQCISPLKETSEEPETECVECKNAVGVAWCINVGKEIKMPGIDKIEEDVFAEKVTPNEAVERIMDYARKIGDEDALDFLSGVRKEMSDV